MCRNHATQLVTVMTCHLNNCKYYIAKLLSTSQTCVLYDEMFAVTNHGHMPNDMGEASLQKCNP